MFKAGFSTRDITPREPCWLGGYASRKKPSCGIHDHIYAKALFITDGTTNAILVSCDVLCLMQKQIDNIRAKTFELYRHTNVSIGATHTHSAPETRHRLKDHSEQNNPEWLSFVEKMVVEAIGEAIKSAEPVKLYGTIVPAPGVAKNRRKGESIVDDALTVIKAENSAGNVKGIIVNYPCHCTVLDSNNYLISSDYPAYIYQKLKKTFSNAAIMFFNGACGNINIGYSADSSALGIDMGDIRTFANAEKKADILIEKINSCIKSAAELEPRLIYKTIPLEFPLKDNLLTSDELAARRSEYIKRAGLCKDDTEKAELQIKIIYYTSLLENVEGYGTDKVRSITGECVFIGLGEILIIGLPLELFCEIGLKIKDIFSDKYRAVIFGYTNGYYGYLPTKAAHIAGGYECETSVHRPDSEDYLIEVMKNAKENFL